MKTYEIEGIKVHLVEDLMDVVHIALPFGFLYGLDVETNGKDPFAPGFKVRMVQMATEHEAYVFRMDEAWQVNYVTSLLADGDTSWCSYTDYDCMAVHAGLRVDISHRNMDLRSFATMASPDDRLGGVDLKTVSEKYLKVSWLKDSQSALNTRFLELYKLAHPDTRPINKAVSDWGWANIPVDDFSYVLYAGLDAVAARRLVPVLIGASGAPFSLVKNQIFLDAEAARMRVRGMSVDLSAKELLYDEKKAACDFHEQEFGEVVWEPLWRGRKPNKVMVEKPISPRSGKKVAMYLHKEGADFTGFPLTDKGLKLLEDGELSTEDEVVGKYASLGKDNKELIKSLNVSPEAEQAIEHLFGFKESAYSVIKVEEINKVLDINNIIHPVLRTCGTVTGRSSSSAPNFQNYPKSDPTLRELHVPPPGYVFIGSDFEQVEVKIAGALSQCPVLLELLTTGASMHEMTMKALGVSKPIAKIYNFAILYGAGPKALVKQTGQDYAQCRAGSDTFWQTYYGLDNYRNSTSRMNPEIRTISNRRIPVPYDWDKRQYKGYVSLNYMIQSAAREMAASAWWRFVNDPSSAGCLMSGFVHDEFVVAVPEDRIAVGLAALQNAMCFSFRGVKISAESIVFALPSGKSVWTTGDAAAKYREEREKNGNLIQGKY